MDRTKILARRFFNFSKYIGIIAAIAFITFLIINAFNTGNDVLFVISYGLLMVAIVGAIQSTCLYFIGKYYSNKSK